MKKLCLITGIPCSGKSTLARQLYDALKFSRMDDYGSDGSDLGAWKHTYSGVGEWLVTPSQPSMILAAPLNTKVARLPMVALLRAMGVQVFGIHARAPLATCMERDTENKYTKAYHISQNSFYEAPSIEEGFDRVYTYNATSLDALKLFVESLQNRA